MTFVTVLAILTAVASASQTPDPFSPDDACVSAGQIRDYDILSDTVVRLTIRPEAGSERALWDEGLEPDFLILDRLLVLEPACPQLHFQNYMYFVPVDGKLCAGRDMIRARTGESCPISRIEPLPRLEVDLDKLRIKTPRHSRPESGPR